MTSTFARKAIRILGSPVLATILLAVVVVYSAAATFVPQGGPADATVLAWSAGHPVLGFLTRLLGMHGALTSVVFLAGAAVLTLSTVLCSWKRTKAAMHRASALRTASKFDAASLAEESDLRVPCDPALSQADVLERAAETLAELGIATRLRDGVLRATSPAWTAWGSPVFHWALVGFMVMVVIAPLLHAEGLMGLAVGEVKVHAPSSYGFLKAGPLHGWDPVRRKVRLDRFESEYVVGGLDRGPTPTVSLLDSNDAVIKSQRVYPNNPLKSGSLTVHAVVHGLAVRLTVLDSQGSPTATGIQYVDFSTDDPAGTRPLGGVVLRDADGVVEGQVRTTVPLDRVDGEFDYWMPAEPTARLLVTAPDGTVIEDSVVAPDQDLTLPIGQSLRVDSIGWYYRLSVVEDATVPIFYALLLVAFMGLATSLIARQQVLVAARIQAPTGPVLAMRVRLWRNVPCERKAILEHLTVRLGPTEGARTHDA